MRLHRIEGASHVDLYDRPEYVGPAIEELAGSLTALGTMAGAVVGDRRDHVTI
ncbi:hypothetical protein [Streptomyces sp. NPDC029554]|uniref:hypothetical protein n=1 Tax=Streptomyces sp. NPDC029554 TaxID=3155126 RepID=UPI0033ED62E1